MTAPKVVMPSQIVMRATASLIGYARNSRTHDQRQIEVLAKSITEYGFTNPILIDGDRGVIAGHGRIMAAEKLGLVEVPCIELRHLTNEQKRAYLILDNQSSLMSGWNEALLAQELADLSGVGIEATDLGFDAAEVDRLMETLGVDFGGKAEGDPDAVPEAPVIPTSKLGDVWLLGKHRVMCGDGSDVTSIQVLLSERVPDAVVTDPPYGIGIDGQKESKTKNPKHNRKAHEFRGWDNKRPDASIFNYIVGLKCPAAIWGGNYFADLLPVTRGWIYWSKGQDGLTMSDGELAWTTESKPLRCVTINRATLQGSIHPTQKPLQVVEFSLDYINAGNTVLDLFGGSGSTLMVCEKTGREARLMELDPAYVDVIVRRWQDFTGKAATLDGDGRTFAEIEEVRRA